MRIKKYQKIICLGMALLSIMVLPCYADYSFTLQAFETPDSNPVEYFIEYDPLFYNALDSFGYVNDYRYIGTLYCDGDVRYYRIITNTPYLSFIKYSQSGINQKLFDSWFEPRYEIPSIDIPDFNFEGELLRVKIYNIDNLPKYNDNEYYFDFYKVLVNYDQSFALDSIILISPVEKAVININTYTKLLIQNLGKAFTFMTGPALAWVLLGISVSLISFGVYSAKRFL